MKKIILASSSPRRRDIFNQIGLRYEIRIPDVCEDLIDLNSAKKECVRLSLKKAEAVEVFDGEVLISADTLVALDDKIFGKPANKDDALRMLTALSGNVHEVITGVTIRSSEKLLSFYEATKVEFYQLSKEEIMQYIESENVMDKAGAYAYQEGKGALLVKGIIGDYYNVVGLPVARLMKELKNF